MREIDNIGSMAEGGKGRFGKRLSPMYGIIIYVGLIVYHLVMSILVIQLSKGVIA